MARVIPKSEPFSMAVLGRKLEPEWFQPKWLRIQCKCSAMRSLMCVARIAGTQNVIDFQLSSSDSAMQRETLDAGEFQMRVEAPSEG